MNVNASSAAAPQEKLEHFRLAVDSALEGFWDWNIPTGKVTTSGRFMEMLGYSPEELDFSYEVWAKTMHLDDRERTINHLKDFLSGKRKIYDPEFRLLHRNGSYRWILSRGKIIERSEDLRPTRMIGIHLDITDRKISEIELKESSISYKHLFESSPLPMYVSNMEGESKKFLAVNRAAVEKYGYSREEFLQMNLLDIRPDFEVERFLSKYTEIKSSPEAGQKAGVWTHRKKNGELIETEITATPLIFAGRQALLVSAVDVTESRKAALKLESNVREKEVLLQEVHHRVKNNLQLVTSLLSLQAHKFEDPELRRHFLDSRDRISSLALVHELLYQRGDFEEIDFRDYLRKIVTSLIAGASDLPIQLQYEVEGEEIHVPLKQAISLGLIVTEWVMNAIKHAFRAPIFHQTKEPRIFLKIHRLSDGKQIELSVKDNGPGFDCKEVKEKSKDRLGLRLVDLLSEQLGAKIGSSQDDGMKMWVRFSLQQNSKTQ